MSITLRITDAGRAALINAAHDGTNAVQIASVGVSPTAIVASPGTAALPGEIKRVATVSGAGVAADVIHIVVRDETTDTYTVRSIALYLADGTLFAAYGQAAPIIEKSAGALMLLAIDATLLDVAASQVTFGGANFLNPPATTETPGVVELATDAEAAGLADAMRVLTPKAMATIFTAANVLARLLSADGAGSGLDADMVDGRHAAEFALLTGATFTGPLAAASLESGAYLRAFGSTPPVGGRGLELLYTNTTGIVQAYNRGTNTLGDLLFYGSAIALTAPVAINGALNVAGAITRSGNRVWDQANDGAGSGLDADLLDGREAGEFALLSGATYTGKVRAPIVESANYIRAQGTGIPQDGAGIELLYGNTTGYLQAFDRTAGVFRELVIYGANIKLEPQGGTVGVAGGMNVAGALTRGNNKVLDVGNDGAGSGFDADLLDGREATDFALVAGGSFTGVTGHAGARIQGAASFAAGVGLELLYSGGNGILQPYDRTKGVFKDLVLYGMNISINPQGGAVGVGGAMNIGGALTRSGNAVMDVGNDGAGSGFDADLLDGHEGSEYDRVTAYSSAFNGYRVLADGTKECWGVVDVPSGGLVEVALPVAHTAWCVPIGSGAGAIGVRSVTGAPPTSFTVRNSSAEALTFRWHSRGV